MTEETKNTQAKVAKSAGSTAADSLDAAVSDTAGDQATNAADAQAGQSSQGDHDDAAGRKGRGLRVVLRLLLVLVVLAAAAAGGGYWYLQKSLESLDAFRPAPRDVYELKAGATATQTAAELTDGRFLDLIIRYWISRHKELQAVQKGSYVINGGLTLAEVLGEMVAGHVIEKEYPKLTLVEGSSWYEFLPRLRQLRPGEEELTNITEAPGKFIRDVLGDDGLKFLGSTPADFEGLLMPATYLVVDGRPAGYVIKQGLTDMVAFLQELWPERDAEALGELTPYDALILASIIERETLLDDERPRVAAVFLNRLRGKMKLQTDPSVMYGIDPLFRGRLTKKMLTADTPYNTYTRSGLPPTPIAMPGRAAITAALHPAEDNALYFVARGVSPREGHVFSATLAEHNKAVAAYRKKVRDYRSGRQSGSDAGSSSEPQAVQEAQDGAAQDKPAQ